VSETELNDAEVLARVEGGVGRLTLNRPAALHALTTNMCALMTQALLAWRADPAVKAVLIDHAGERGFCAGGDIRMLADSGAGDGAAAREFFFTEYRLNHLLFVYPKPVVAIMDGVTMGGGVGLSMPARFRVATERTTFAMPETGIGLFPDVGGGWFLPRLPGRTGLWLALTGARIKAADCLALGVATQFVEAARIADLKAAVIASPEWIAEVVARFASDRGPAPIAAQRPDIDRLFAGDSVEAIVTALTADGGDWAAAQLKTLSAKSPQTMKVALRQLAVGGALTSFADNMAMEYRIGARVVRRHDFLEGVRAVIVDKDNAPRWNPASLEGVTEADLDAIFAPLPDDQEWTPLAQTLETAA
jgi:enoyl-CoA hydratase